MAMLPVGIGCLSDKVCVREGGWRGGEEESIDSS